MKHRLPLAIALCAVAVLIIATRIIAQAHAPHQQPVVHVLAGTDSPHPSEPVTFAADIEPAPLPIWRPRPPIPPGEFWPPIQRVLSVDSVMVKATIANGVAQTDVTQIFRNDTDTAQEGSYLFPVPEGAVLSDFALYDGDKKLTARLLDKDEASSTYEGIVMRERDPALLQYVGRNTYEVRLYPVPPRGTRKITLSYTEPLRTEGADAQKYVFSFAADALCGADQSTPIKSASVQVQLKDTDAITNVYSPTQQISVRRSGDNAADVTWESGGGKVDRDFILYYSTVRHDPVGLAMLAYNVSLPGAQTAAFSPGHEGPRDSGYFLMMASPRTQLLDTQIMPKRVFLVLDRSGSMAGPKIEQARGALAYVLKNLRPTDQFNVMTFNEDVDVLSPDGMLDATPDNIRRGLDYVQGIQAEGGTNIHDALVTALKLFPDGDQARRQNSLIFMTDGLPTVGETNQATIIDDAQKISQARSVRLFAFGEGYDVDVHFLDRLAEENHGDADYVRPEEDIEAKVSDFYTKIASPVLTDVSVEINGVRTADIYPRPDNLPDLFAGSQLLIAGRYTGQGPVTARLIGKVNGQPTVFHLESNLPAVTDADDFLPRLWAMRKIGYLMDAIRQQQTDGGDAPQNGELVDEVVQLSKQYGVITPYTSFLVTEDTDDQTFPPVPYNGPIPPVQRPWMGGPPIIMPQSGAAGGSQFQKSFAADAAPVSGSEATTMSQSLRAMQSATVAAPPIAFSDAPTAHATEHRMKVVGAKTFYMRAGVWTDSAYDPAKNKAQPFVVKALSDAQFALIEASPKLAAYSALGDDVLIVLADGSILRLSSKEGMTSFDAAALQKVIAKVD